MHKVLFSLLIVFVFASAFCGCVSAEDTWNGIELNWTWYSDDTSVNEFYIYDEGSLAALSEKTSYNTSTKDFKGKTIHLMNNIDLSSICNASTDTSWIPIGTKSEEFSGNFEGNGKTISNLYINKPSDNYQGLFGYIYSTSNITNLTLTNVNVTGNSQVGGLVGFYQCDNAKTYFIDNCSVSGNISGVWAIGGLIGVNYFGIIKNCSSTVKVTGSNEQIGGLIGCNCGTIIENCYANAEVSGVNNNVGGLVGYNNLDVMKIIKSCIKNCFASGNVSGKDNVGGLVGYNTITAKDGKLTISNCYANAEVSGKDKVGGLIGYNSLGSAYDASYSIIIIENTYATCNVSGGDYPFGGVGGLIGQNDFIKKSCSKLYINNSVALNKYVNSKPKPKFESVGRIAGYSKYDSTCTFSLNNNYGWKGIKNGINTFKTENKLNQKNGNDVSNTNVWCSKSFFVNTLHWDFDKTWAIDKEDTGTNYPLPYLKSLGKYDSLREKVIYLMPDYEVSVKFDKNGGAGTMPVQTFKYGVSNNLKPNNFTRTGYKFIGWNTNADGSGKNYKDEDSIIITAETTLYAVWTKITNVTLYFNNTTGGTQIVNISYDNNTFNETLTTPIYAGHTFLGYFNESDGGVQVINESLLLEYNIHGYTNESGYWNNNSSNINLYAQWKTNVTNVTLHFNNSTTCGTQIVNISYDNNTFNETLTIPIYAGHTFLGYNSTKGGGVQVINKDRTLLKGVSEYTNETGYWINESSNVELWAAWSVNSYNVTFNSNNETPVNVNQTVSYGVGTPLNKFDTLGFSKAGHTFIGWNNSTPPGNIVNYEDGSSITIYKDTVLYAVWKANITNITLHFNNTTGGTQTVNISYDNNTFNEILTTPSYAGHTFLGYFNESDGGVQVINESLGLVPNYVSGYTDETGYWNNNSSDINLYAQWKTNVTNITLHFGNGSSITHAVNITYGNNSFNETLTTQIYPGHTFLGYFNESSGGVLIINESLGLVPNYVKGYTNESGYWNNNSTDINLYAQWKTNVTNVTLHFNNSTTGVTHAVNITYGNNSFNKTLTTPIYAGHTFLGYFNESIGGVLIINESLGLVPNYVKGYTNETGYWNNNSTDINLYARWQSNVTNVTLHFNNDSSITHAVNITYGNNSFNETLTTQIYPGHTFLGYFNESSSGVLIINESLGLEYNIHGYTNESGYWNNNSSDINLYAQWKTNVTNVTLHFNNSTTGETQIVNITYGDNKFNQSLTTPSYAGHTFLGYFNESSSGVLIINESLGLVPNYVSGYTNETGYWNNNSTDINLYAQWKTNVTNITLHFNNDSSITHAVNITYGKNSFNETLTTPIYPGHTFLGYFNESDGGVLVINDALKLVYNEVNYTSSGKWINTSSNITLYAHWIQNPPSDNSSTSSTTYTGWVIYTVYFDSCGGSHIDNQTNLRYGEKVKKPDDPTRDGYIFDGWYTQDSYKWDFKNDTVNDTFTLYAKWKLIEVQPTEEPHHGCWIAIIILLITAAVITAVIIKKKHDKKKDEENYDVLS